MLIFQMFGNLYKGKIMKKTILLITAVTVFFSFSTVFAQNQVVSIRLEYLSSALSINYNKLQKIFGDFFSIIESIPDDRILEARSILNINGNIHEAHMVHQYLLPFLSFRSYVKEDNVQSYYKNLLNVLLFAKDDLDNDYKSIQTQYSYLESDSALHNTDKAKDTLRDSIGKIDSAIKTLSKVTNSSQ